MKKRWANGRSSCNDHGFRVYCRDGFADRADLSGPRVVENLIEGHAATLSACRHFLTPIIAAAATKAKPHYFGSRDGRLEQETHAQKIYSQKVNGQLLSAIQITTASRICAMVDLVVQGKLPKRGLLRQEDAKLGGFLNNRFGRYHAI